MRIGIASFAHLHASSYARILTGTSGVELLIADPDAAPAQDWRQQAWQRAQAAGAVPLPGYDELFAAGLDGLIVCSENAAHRDLVVRAAAAGIPVLCEKPLATTLADGRAMVAACDQAGVPLMMAYPVRFSPAIAELNQAVQLGTLGALQACVGRNNGRIPLAGRSWFTDQQLAGGGALMDHVVHLADILLMLLGSPPVQVYAQANRIFHGGTVPVETGGILALTFGSGMVATIDFSWSRPDSYPVWGGLTLELAGDRGSMTADVFGPTLTGFSDDTGGPVWLSLAADLDRLMLAEFLAAVSEGRPPLPDGRAGLATLEIVLAGYESARTGQPVALRSLPG